MNVGELIDKLAEVPADTPVEFVIYGSDNACYRIRVDVCDYDEERGVVRLS